MLVVLAGCAATPERYDPARRPADFSLRVTLEAAGGAQGQGVTAQDVDELPTEPGQYVVMPDRELRVALGPGATADVYPGRTAVLSPREMDELWRRTVEAWRSARRASSQAQDPPRSAAIALRVRFRGAGRSRSFTTSLRDPAGRSLAAWLVSMRGGEGLGS